MEYKVGEFIKHADSYSSIEKVGYLSVLWIEEFKKKPVINYEVPDESKIHDVFQIVVTVAFSYFMLNIFTYILQEII